MAETYRRYRETAHHIGDDAIALFHRRLASGRCPIDQLVKVNAIAIGVQEHLVTRLYNASTKRLCQLT